MVAAAVVVAAIALPVLAVSAGVVATVAIVGAAAGLAGTIIDTYFCTSHHNNLACAGAIVGGVATALASGGLAIPAELAGGYAAVTLPYIAGAATIDIVSGVNDLGAD